MAPSESLHSPPLILDVVPPTPTGLPSPSPSSRTTASSTSSFPNSTLDWVRPTQERSSSDTTVGSIYSMYAEEKPKQYSTELAYAKAPPANTVDITKVATLAVNGNARPRPNSYNTSPPAFAPKYENDRRASTGQASSNIRIRSPSPKTPPARSSSLKQLPTLPSPSHTPSSALSTPALPPLPPSASPSPSPAPGRSAVSLAPSTPQAPNEEPDAHHVRSTYALLETTGVSGDGFMEGVERTRARVGASRKSQLLADGALASAEEKTRTLSEAETRVLASLDRYGFLNAEMQTSHERLLLLPSDALGTKGLHLLRDSRKSPRASPPQLPSLPVTRPPLKETSRMEKWTRMLVPASRDVGGNVGMWRIKEGKERKLKRRLYKGIPDRWRGAAWTLLLRQAAGRGKGKAKADWTVDHTEVDLSDWEHLESDYREALDLPSSYDVQIDLDVPRTIGGHVMFKTRYGTGQRSLFHVLHSFSLRCESCGYVQGMGPITASLLLYLPPSVVYSSLCTLHSAPLYSLHTLFSPGFPGLLEGIYVQERLMQTYMPSVYAAFKTIGVSTTSYATKWYITMFANSVQFQTQLRLWDVWLLEGEDAWVVLAVGVVFAYRDYIMAEGANFETVLSLLSSFFVVEDEDTLLSWMEKTLGNRKIRKQMLDWRQEWRGLVSTGQEMNALL